MWETVNIVRCCVKVANESRDKNASYITIADISWQLSPANMNSANTNSPRTRHTLSLAASILVASSYMYEPKQRNRRMSHFDAGLCHVITFMVI